MRARPDGIDIYINCKDLEGKSHANGMEKRIDIANLQKNKSQECENYRRIML